METHLRTELVLQALNMALYQRRPDGVIHHSDQGCQYTSIAFGLRCGEAGVRPSMGSVGDAYDNALCESFFATLECELLDRNRFRTQVEACMAVFQFLEGWYNPHRLPLRARIPFTDRFRASRARRHTSGINRLRSKRTDDTEGPRGKIPPRAPPERQRWISTPGRRGSRADVTPKPVTVYETGVGPDSECRSKTRRYWSVISLLFARRG